MIAEAIQQIEAMTNLNRTPSIVHPPEEPAHVYLLNGQLKVAVAKPRDNQAYDLAAIFKMVNAGQDDDAKKVVNYEVWYSHEGIVCFLDRENRRSKVSMKLELSDQLATIREWGKSGIGHSISQTELILMLRTRFKYAQSTCPRLLPAIRQLKFFSSNNTDSHVSTGKVSIGKKIESEVSGVQEVPEDFILNVPVFKKVFPGMEAKIEICLDMNATAEKLILLPVAASIDLALAKAESNIGDMLAEELDSDRVLFGKP